MKEINEILIANKAIYLSISLQERTLGLDSVVKPWSSLFGLNTDIFFYNLTQQNFINLNENGDTTNVIIKDSNDREIIPLAQDFSNILRIFAQAYQSNKPGIYIIENIDIFLSSDKLSVFEYEHLKSWVIKLHHKFRNQDDFYLVLLGTEHLDWELNDIIPRVGLPFLTIDEIQSYLTETFAKLKVKDSQKTHLIKKGSHILLGLTRPEVEWGINNITNSLEDNKTVEDYLNRLLIYKQDKLKNLGLEFLPPPSIGQIGGMDILKDALEQLAGEFAPEARIDKIPLPKGWILAGVSGAGKSFTAKVMAQTLRVPMIYAPIDTIKSKGAAYLAWILKQVEAAAPNLVYFDEFDKLFSAEPDLNTTAILGVLLTWLQEKQTQSFALATLNRLDALPPELTRPGRFDNVFYVGFPQPNERQEIYKLHIRKYDYRFKAGFDFTLEQWRNLIIKTIRFTGAEIATIVEKTIRKKYRYKQQQKQKVIEQIEARKEQILNWIDLKHQEEIVYASTEDLASEIKKAINCKPEIIIDPEHQIEAELAKIAQLQVELKQCIEQKLEIDYDTLYDCTCKEISLFKRDPEGVLAMENRARKGATPVSSQDESGLIPNDGTFWPAPEPVEKLIDVIPLPNNRQDVHTEEDEIDEAEYSLFR